MTPPLWQHSIEAYLQICQHRHQGDSAPFHSSLALPGTTWQQICDLTGLPVDTPDGPFRPSPALRLCIGILGGLGPHATADLFSKILRCTPASCDQDHLHILIDNHPAMPDRTAFLLNPQRANPLPAMLATARNLEQAGADFLLIPCNTAHAFLPALQPHLRIPVLSMIEATCRHVRQARPDIRRVGLLATTGTISSRVYADVFAAAGMTLLTPEPETQENQVMSAIYGPEGIKARGANSPCGRQLLLASASQLLLQGAQAMILGCTEIPLVLNPGDFSVPCLDPTLILAQAAVDRALTGR